MPKQAIAAHGWGAAGLVVRDGGEFTVIHTKEAFIGEPGEQDYIFGDEVCEVSEGDDGSVRYCVTEAEFRLLLCRPSEVTRQADAKEAEAARAQADAEAAKLQADAEATEAAKDNALRSEALFHMIDADGNGEIDVAELLDFMLRAGMHEDEVSKLFAELDRNGDGVINRGEFRRGYAKYAGAFEAAQRALPNFEFSTPMLVMPLREFEKQGHIAKSVASWRDEAFASGRVWSHHSTDLPG